MFRTLGEKIKFLRKGNKLTQKELANKVGYTSKSTISKIEKNIIKLDFFTLMEFCEALNTTIDFLLFDIKPSIIRQYKMFEDSYLNFKNNETTLLYKGEKMNLINIYGFYKKQSEETNYCLEYCVYEINLENSEKFILCDSNGKVFETFETELQLLKYLLENKYRQLSYSIDTW